MIEELGSKKDNQFSIWELEQKLKYVDDHFDDLCKNPDKMDDFE